MRKLSHFNTASTIIKNMGAYSENINLIKNSKLSEEMKEKALEEGTNIVKKILLLTFFDVFITVIVTIIGTLYFINLTDDTISFLIMSVAIGLVCCSIAIIGTILIRKSCPTYYRALDLIRREMDGLSEIEIEGLLLNEDEKKLLKSYKRHGYIWAIIWIALLVYMIVVFNMVRLIRIEKGIGLITVLIFTVITIPCWVKIQKNDKIIKELESGYIGKFSCNTCNVNHFIRKNQINNNRVMCAQCGKIFELKEEYLISKPSFFKSKKTLAYIIIITLVLMYIGATFDFRTEEEKRWDSIKETLDTSDMNDTKDKMDKINSNLNELKNAPKTYEDDLEDVKEATSNINDILNELNAIKNTEHD